MWEVPDLNEGWYHFSWSEFSWFSLVCAQKFWLHCTWFVQSLAYTGSIIFTDDHLLFHFNTMVLLLYHERHYTIIGFTCCCSWLTFCMSRPALRQLVPYTYMWTIWVLRRASFAITTIHIKVHVRKYISYECCYQNQLSCEMFGIIRAWEIHWNLCPSFFKALQGEKKNNARIPQLWESIVSETWENNNVKWKSYAFHLGLKIMNYFNTCHCNHCRTYLQFSSGNSA